MVDDHWFRQVDKTLEAMEITSNAARIKLVAFQLEGESQVWWDWVKASRNLEATTWEEFRKLFMGKHFPTSTRHEKVREFLELKQGTMTRAGNLSPARWASPTNPKLGPGWSLILLARKNRAKCGPARLTRGLNGIGSG